MPSSVHLERYWLMDVFGRFLQYDSMSQRLITTPFTPQAFPNLFTFLPKTENFPRRAVLRLLNSIPSALPPLRFLQLKEDKVAIEDVTARRFLTTKRDEARTTWEKEIDQFQSFLRLNIETLVGLSILTDPDLMELSIEASQPYLTFGREDHDKKISAKIADIKIKFAENFSEFSKIARCKPFEKMELFFETYAESHKSLSLTVTPKRALHLTSFYA